MRIVGERGESQLPVLLVDHSAKVRQTLATLLSAVSEIEMDGEEQDGLAAIEAVGKLSPCLVLDLRMQRRNGFEVLKAIKEEQRKSIFIVFSAMADDVCRQKCLELGARDFFDKATQSDAFLPAVKALLAK